MKAELEVVPLSSWVPTYKRPLIISGPCGAESEEQVLQTAAGLAALNRVTVFRSGIWKPRTRPNSFEGVGAKGLLWLKEVKQRFNFLTTVEVATAQHVEECLKNDVDILWIGARTTVNPFSVQAIADALRGVAIPVMVKNPIHADLQLWIGALERLNKVGINQLAAIHRGFYSYRKNNYRNVPLWELPIELKTLFPQLPIICDPSHICGNTHLISGIAQRALDLNFDGLMIESHYKPSEALSDKQQQLEPAQLEILLNNLVIRNHLCSNESNLQLEDLRKSIDEIDEEIINWLSRRMDLVEKIGAYKRENNIMVLQLERWLSILETRSSFAQSKSLNKEFIEKIYKLIHRESIRKQTEVIKLHPTDNAGHS